MLGYAFRMAIYTCCLTLLNTPLLARAEALKRPIEAQIKSENGRWAEAYARGDYSAIGDLYTDDGMLLPPGEGRVIGQRAIVAYFKKKSHNAAPHIVTFDNFEFFGDDNTVTEISDTEIRDQGGKLISRGRQTLVFLKKNGFWKLHRDMWNADMPLKSDDDANGR